MSERVLFIGGPKHDQEQCVGSDSIGPLANYITVPYGRSPVAALMVDGSFDLAKDTIQTINYELRRFVYPKGSKDGGPLLVACYVALAPYSYEVSEAFMYLIGTELGKLPLEMRGEPGFWLARRLMQLHDEFVRGVARALLGV